jgi:chitinase
MYGKMATVTLITLLVLRISFAHSSHSRVVCYFTSWTIYRPDIGKFQAANIDPTLCTHINYAYIGIYENGNVLVLDDWEQTLLEEVKHLMNLKQKNPNLKVLASMGGWNEGSTKYSHVAADPEKRATMVQSVLKYMEKHGFDGLDLDWEYPGQRGGDPENDFINFVTLLGELKTALNAKGYILSAVVTADEYSMDISYPDVRAISNNLDQINILTYESSSTLNSLNQVCEQEQSSVEEGIKRWLDKGADSSKLNLGVVTYGRSFKSDDPSTPKEVLGYYEICQLGPEWEYIWDDVQKIPYKINGDQWITYEDTESIGIKTDFVKEMSLGGVAVWSFDTDDFLGLCGAAYPLLHSINYHLN